MSLIQALAKSYKTADPYTRADREEAAWAISILASNTDIENTEDVLEEGTPAFELAVRAFFSTPCKDASGREIPYVEQRAEAESRVRTGWVPE